MNKIEPTTEDYGLSDEAIQELIDSGEQDANQRIVKMDKVVEAAGEEAVQALLLRQRQGRSGIARLFRWKK